MVMSHVLDPESRQRLIALAHEALEARVHNAGVPDIDPNLLPEVQRGVFVSIFRNGELRGCLGRLESPLPLASLVVQLAQAVADSDPRFERVTPQELSEIGLEISVLTREQEVDSVTEIEVGRHGLIVEQGASRGLLLPQVPLEHGWDRDAFLSQTCLKAGLSADAWRRGARIFVFEAQVFGERADG
jgi:AmmeMemoRadiSam system protein A